MTLGQKIKAARLKAGLSQEEVASRLSFKIRNTAISSWENDKSKPDIDTIQELSSIFNVSPTYFLDFDNTSNKTPSRPKYKSLGRLEEIDDLSDKEDELIAAYIAFIKSQRGE